MLSTRLFAWPSRPERSFGLRCVRSVDPPEPFADRGVASSLDAAAGG